jgi:Transposase domain (DUF772).
MVKLSCPETINHAPKKGVVTYMIPYHQLTLADVFTETQELFESDKPEFLKLLESSIDLSELIPVSFGNHFYASTGRPREYSLTSLLWALIIQRIFSIPTDSLLLTFLEYSKDLREFCGFTKVPDASKITRFKQEFIDDLQMFFDSLVDLTEPILQEIDAEKASMSVFDTTGLEAYVTENNPKYANQKIRQLKAWAKTMGFDKSYDPYKAAYGSMPTHASADPEIKQQYLNGHFCYAYKAGVLTNGLGIIRAIEFYDKDYFASHPEIERYKKTDAPDEDKSIGDARLLLPLLKDFFRKHPLINPKTFLGDAAFDSIEIYKTLLSGDTFGYDPDGTPRIFEKAYIPLRSATKLTNPDYIVNENGFPCCPHDPTLPMKPEGNTSHLRCGLKTFKFVCPKMKWETIPDGKSHSRRVCTCDNPCTDSKCGRMVYLYPEKDLRLCPGVLRGTDEWESTYKIRTSVERSINHIKDSFCLGERKTQNAKTLHADLLLAGITQLITVVVADRIHKPEYFRSLKRLIA